ncbi:MAG: putative porin [Culturomica sp.]|jgi:hypothetical protein|nr:putative porin [Culturomica sp.]
MKKFFYISLIFILHFTANAQQALNVNDDNTERTSTSPSSDVDTVPHYRMMWQWKRGGVYKKFIPIDTTIDKNHIFNPIFQKSIANSYLGNLGSPYESDVFMNRATTEDFYMITNVRAYLYRIPDVLEFNTTTPFTQLTYFTGGGKGKAENYLNVWHTQNIRPNWNMGIRYLLQNGDGRYMNQKTKTYNLSLFTSYEKERWVLSAFINQNNAHINENGGITDKSLLTDSEYDPESVPTFLAGVKNTYRNFNFNTTVQYNIGKLRQRDNSRRKDNAVNDTIASDSVHIATDSLAAVVDDVSQQSVATGSMGEWIYPFKATVSLSIEDNSRRFKETSVTTTFFPYSYFDSTEYGMDMSGVRMYDLDAKLVVNEHPKYKYLPGLYAGLDFKTLRYQDRNDNFADTVNGFTYTNYRSTWLTGGIFNVDTAALFHYDLNARLSVLGDYLGDFVIDGFLRQYLSKNRNSYVNVSGEISSLAPNHFFNRYTGNHNIWRNDFNNVKHLNIKGKYVNKKLRTELGVGINNTVDYLYLDSLITPSQSSKNVVIATAWVEQIFRLGLFYFNQSVYFQKSTDEDIIALPAISLLSHNYYQNRLFQVLDFCVGFDLYYNSEFYADKYDPSTMAFYQQRQVKTGNYPKLDVFLDMQLKRAILFLKYEHLNYHFSNGNYFTAVNYPINPAMLKFGIRWNFFD